MANREFFFFYPPTWEYPPDGPIKLGNVLSSIKTPHKPLGCIPPSDGPEPFVTEKRSVDYTKEKLRSGRFSVLTKFLSILGFGIDIGAEVDNEDEEKFSFDTVETTQFIPTRAYLDKCLQLDQVSEFLEFRSYRKPVYIITGLKVARGAEANTLRSRGVGGDLAAEVDATLLSGGVVPVGGGPGVRARVGNKTSTSWKGSSDFVFAFRVSRVYAAEVTGGVAREEEYRKGAMLGDDARESRRPGLTVLGVEEPDAQSEGFDAEKLVDDGEEMVFCAVPRSGA